MLRRIKSVGDSSKNILLHHFPSINKKNYILFSLLALHYHNDQSQIFSILKRLYDNGLLEKSDLLEFEKYVRYYQNIIVQPKPQLTMECNDYIYLDALGKGAYGTVYKVMHRIDQQIYALKEISHDGPNALREIQTMAKLDHLHIVRYYHSFLRNDTLCIQMQYCPSSLKQWLNAETRTNHVDIIRSLMDGVQYLHEQGFIHFDLKPDNILFDDRNVLKLCDFGFAKLFSPHLDETSVAFNIYSPNDPTVIDYDVDWYAVCVIIIEMYLPKYVTNMEKIITIRRILQEKIFSFTIHDLALLEKIENLFQRIFSSGPCSFSTDSL